MNYSGPPVNHPISPWFQSQQTPQFVEQYIPGPSTSPYVSDITLPSTSYTQDRVVNYNYESRVCEQQTIAGMVNPSGSCQLHITIPFDSEPVNQQMTLDALSRVGLKEIIFLGPRPSAMTFSFNFTDLTRILETLAAIPGMHEIELTLPTASEASKLNPESMEMVYIQQAFIRGLQVFRHLKRLTIPMEIVTPFLLSYLAISNLESLTVKCPPPPRSPHHHRQFPVWSSHTAVCPGNVFLARLSFDPRGYFRQLSRIDLGAPLSDASYTTLRTLFPKAHIC
jgi:hypothetical protein